MRRGCATVLTALGARPGSGLPPLMRVPGASPSHELKCCADGIAEKSGGISGRRIGKTCDQESKAMASAGLFPLVSRFAVGEEGDLLCGRHFDLGGGCRVPVGVSRSLTVTPQGLEFSGEMKKEGYSIRARKSSALWDCCPGCPGLLAVGPQIRRYLGVTLLPRRGARVLLRMERAAVLRRHRKAIRVRQRFKGRPVSCANSAHLYVGEARIQAHAPLRPPPDHWRNALQADLQPTTGQRRLVVDA